MLQFDSSVFRKMLQAIPEKEAPTTAVHSDYLQTQVFDKLRAGERVLLKDIDWNAFDLSHVTDENWKNGLATQTYGWAQGFHSLARKAQAAASPMRKFF